MTIRRRIVLIALRTAEIILISAFTMFVALVFVIGTYGGVFSPDFYPLGDLAGAASDGNYTYVASFSPGLIVALDNEMRRIKCRSMDVSPIKLDVKDQKIVITHSGNPYTGSGIPTNVGPVHIVPTRRSGIRPQVWDETRGRWVTLESAYLSILRAPFPAGLIAIPLIFFAGFVRHHRLRFERKAKNAAGA